MRHQPDEEYDPDLDYGPEPGGPEGPPVDPAKVQHYIDLLRSRQHMPMAVMGGFGGAVLGAAAWVGVSSLLDLQVGWMAIVVGVAVGLLMRFPGHCVDMPASIFACILSILGILAGVLGSGCAAAARQSKELGFFDQVAQLDLGAALAILQGSFSVMDAIFAAAGLLAAFVLARRWVSVKGIMKQAEKLRAAA